MYSRNWDILQDGEIDILVKRWEEEEDEEVQAEMKDRQVKQEK